MKKYINEIKFLIIIQLVCDAVFTSTVAFIPYLNKLLFDIVLQDGNRRISFSLIVFLYISSMLLGLIFSYISTIYVWKGALRFEMSLKRDFFKSIFSYNYEEFSSKNIGEYISIQGKDITELEQDYLQPFIDIIKSINMLVIYSVILFIYVEWRIATTIFLASLLTILIPKLTSKALSSRRNIYLKQVGEYVSKIKDFLEGFKLIQISTRENINNEHEKALQATADKRLIYGKFKTLTGIINNLSMNCVSIAAFVIVGILLLKREITVGTGVATFGYINCFIAPIESILYDINSMNSLKQTKERVLSYMKNNSEPNLISKEEFKQDIVFDHVSFHYNNFSLQDISYKFKKGKKYALIGHSGSGKSTMLNMIMKYRKPDTGNILLDGEELHSFDSANIMYCINQNEHIFLEDFLNNATVYSSYSSVKLDEVIRSLKLKTLDIIKEKQNCQLLSGGEKQVLGIVRMLTADTPICIMDEPFASTDMNTTQTLQNVLLGMKDKTIIMVTHKLSEQLEQFDEILLMEDGKIVQSGTYDEIFKTSEFKRLQEAS